MQIEGQLRVVERCELRGEPQHTQLIDVGRRLGTCDQSIGMR